MKKIFFLLSIICCVVSLQAQSLKSSLHTCKVETAKGIVEGVVFADGIHCFKGIPYAQPPVGPLRWKSPRPVKKWKGVLKVNHFKARPMQNRIYNDMVFRSKKISEDCLYLNIWTSAKSDTVNLPVLVYFYGGGFQAGGSSEPRYDGESMAQKGIVTVTVNYRLGIFGFLSLPALSKTSPHHSSGNYGLLDQSAALKWIHKNIAAFGGNPERVTIAGQSAGSMSVSAQMASPLSKGLFIGAIGESGSALGNLTPRSLNKSEQMGLRFMHLAAANNLSELRKMSASQILKVAVLPNCPHFGPCIDGYFLPESPEKIYSTGLQANVPLLVGWNSAEVDYHSLLGNQKPTVVNYKKALRKLFGKKAAEAFKLYPAKNISDVKKSATALASDKFIAYATWKWIDLHSKTDGKPVYRYLYAHLLPKTTNQKAVEGSAQGAPHSAEIPYALGNLHLIKSYQWTKNDYKVSAIMQDYFVNFIKTGDPNKEALPVWPVLQSSIPKVMVINTHSKAIPERNKKRYLFLDQFYHHQ